MKIVIDGSIGAGKTTILKMLQERGYKVVMEPIDEWPLEEFYKDPERWTFLLQMSILKSFSNRDSDTIHERCMQTSYKVFFEMLKEIYTFHPKEIEIYDYFYEKHKWTPDIHIYLKASPEKCYENIHKRSQTGDSYVDIGYLRKLNFHYDEFIASHPYIKVVDANADIDTVFKNVCSLIE